MSRRDRATSPISYQEAGVNIDTATVAVSRIAERAQRAFGGPPAGVGEAGPAAAIGHFGGLYRLPSGPDRLLVASADGVGTKLKLAFLLGGDAHERMGQDLVNHCVNDILTLGAKPLFFLDYFATGQLDPETLDGVVAGLVAGCQVNGMALIGGETAEMPGFYAPGEYDLAGFIVGEVAPDDVIDGGAIDIGDVVIGLPSGGLQTNGYSLARRIVGLDGVADEDQAKLATPLPGGDGVTIGEALMAPHQSFLPVMTALRAAHPTIIRGMAHITGGGLVDNLPRMLPAHLTVRLDRSAWKPPAIFRYLVQVGSVPAADHYRAFNMGIGFSVVVRSADVDVALGHLPGAVVIGEVEPRGVDESPIPRGLPNGDETDE